MRQHLALICDEHKPTVEVEGSTPVCYTCSGTPDSPCFTLINALAMTEILNKHRETRFWACQADGDLEPDEIYSAIPDPDEIPPFAPITRAIADDGTEYTIKQVPLDNTPAEEPT